MQPTHSHFSLVSRSISDTKTSGLVAFGDAFQHCSCPTRTLLKLHILQLCRTHWLIAEMQQTQAMGKMTIWLIKYRKWITMNCAIKVQFSTYISSKLSSMSQPLISNSSDHCGKLATSQAKQSTSSSNKGWGCGDTPALQIAGKPQPLQYSVTLQWNQAVGN